MLRRKLSCVLHEGVPKPLGIGLVGAEVVVRWSELLSSPYILPFRRSSPTSSRYWTVRWSELLFSPHILPFRRSSARRSSRLGSPRDLGDWTNKQTEAAEEKGSRTYGGCLRFFLEERWGLWWLGVVCSVLVVAVKVCFLEVAKERGKSSAERSISTIHSRLTKAAKLKTWPFCQYSQRCRLSIEHCHGAAYTRPS